MKFNKILCATATLAGALALGACSASFNQPVTDPAFTSTKAGALPAGQSLDTLPSGRRLMANDMDITFRGRRTQISDINGRPMRASAWRMQGDTYCGRRPNRTWRCYEVYATGQRDSYDLRYNGRFQGRVSLH